MLSSYGEAPNAIGAAPWGHGYSAKAVSREGRGSGEITPSQARRLFKEIQEKGRQLAEASQRTLTLD